MQPVVDEDRFEKDFWVRMTPDPKWDGARPPRAFARWLKAFGRRYGFKTVTYGELTRDQIFPPAG